MRSENAELLGSVLTALAKIQGHEDEVDPALLRKLDELAWQIHDEVAG